jgi:hypothetical protein
LREVISNKLLMVKPTALKFIRQSDLITDNFDYVEFVRISLLSTYLIHFISKILGSNLIIKEKLGF